MPIFQDIYHHFAHFQDDIEYYIPSIQELAVFFVRQDMQDKVSWKCPKTILKCQKISGNTIMLCNDQTWPKVNLARKVTQLVTLVILPTICCLPFCHFSNWPSFFRLSTAKVLTSNKNAVFTRTWVWSTLQSRIKAQCAHIF